MRASLRRLRSTHADSPAGAVTTIELFFDLTFVFAVTQLDSRIEFGDGWSSVGQVVLLLLLMWWMYSGYAWLTNAAPPITAVRRAMLMLGMAGNFVMALAIPHAFGVDSLTFALGYLLVVLVHALMYVTQSTNMTTGLVIQLLGWNLTAAVIVVVGAVVGGRAQVWLWTLAFVVCAVLPRIVPIPSSQRADPTAEGPRMLTSAHFVERHGLMLLIVLGESVLAIGVGIGGGAHAIGPAQVLFAVVSLGLAMTLYAAYFGTHEDRAAEHAMDTVPSGRLATLALNSFGVSFWVILLGTVLTAASLHHALAEPTRRLPSTYAVELAGGVALVWFGLAMFRLAIGRRDVGPRVATAILGLGCAVLGTRIAAFAELVVVLAIGLGCLALERSRVAAAGSG